MTAGHLESRHVMADDLKAIHALDRELSGIDSEIIGSKHYAGYDRETKDALEDVHCGMRDLLYELWSTKYALVKEAGKGADQ